MQSSTLSYLSIFKTRPSQLHLHLLQKEKQHIYDPLNCKSKNLIYFIECKKCGKQYIGPRPSAISTTDALGSIAAPFSTIATFPILLLSPNILIKPDHSINDVLLIPLELIRSMTLSERHAKLTSLTKL